MWKLIFFATEENSNKKHHFVRNVSADEMFDAIKYGIFELSENVNVTFDDEGRSPKNGIRIFKNCIIHSNDD